VSARVIPTWLLIALVLTTGLAAGILIGRHWRATALSAQWRRGQRAASEAWRRRLYPDEWRRDSLARAAIDSIHMRQPLSRPPREIARQQIFNDCAVAFTIRDTIERVRFFEVRASLIGISGHVVTKASTYRPNGFGAGDTVWLVLRDMPCGDFAIRSFAHLTEHPESLRVRAR
jgi:hypothetical protein